MPPEKCSINYLDSLQVLLLISDLLQDHLSLELGLLGLSHTVKVVIVGRLQNQTDPIVELLSQELIQFHLESALFSQKEL